MFDILFAIILGGTLIGTIGFVGVEMIRDYVNTKDNVSDAVFGCICVAFAVAAAVALTKSLIQ